MVWILDGNDGITIAETQKRKRENSGWKMSLMREEREWVLDWCHLYRCLSKAYDMLSAVLEKLRKVGPE